ncbi:MAG: hypothetical protein KDK70_00055 [Myxococcales bacterium]|nr:hypothetical protein [Myxococcales bacterium]
MNLHRGLGLLTFTFIALAGPGLARAATANCMSGFGSCSVSNDGFDWIDCMCADGSGGGGGGGNTWAGLSEMDLQPICEEQLTSFCGPFVPPSWVECDNLFGTCIIDNEPVDSIECWCIDGSSGNASGGNMWAGYSDVQLLAECETLLGAYCAPPASSVMCSNTNGECTLANVPEDFLVCECVDGSGGGFGGGNGWAAYSELQLYGECGTQLVGMCGGPLPPAPWVECSSGLGECTIDNDPEDLLDCTCTDGTVISSNGGNAWAGLSENELLMECEAQLQDGCYEEAGSSSGGETGTTGTTGDPEPTGTTGTTGEGSSGPDPDSSGGPGSSSGTPPPGTTGSSDGASTGGSDDGEPGAADGGDTGCACSAGEGPSPGGWALLWGLVLVGRGRRARRREAGRARASR